MTVINPEGAQFRILVISDLDDWYTCPAALLLPCKEDVRQHPLYLALRKLEAVPTSVKNALRQAVQLCQSLPDELDLIPPYVKAGNVVYVVAQLDEPGLFQHATTNGWFRPLKATAEAALTS